jgi:hypothetical protein
MNGFYLGTSSSGIQRKYLQFYGNKATKAYLFTDNQAAEHIATKQTMNEHSRSIDIRHHAVRQDYLEGKVQIRGVKTTENPSDILTKFLPAPTHMKHTSPLNINFQNTPTDTSGISDGMPGQGFYHGGRTVMRRYKDRKGSLCILLFCPLEP